MISLIIWLLILSTGSVFAAVLWDKKYEEVLPITCAILISILYLFGVFNQLQLGFYTVVLLSISIYIGAIGILLKKKHYKQVSGNILTPSFCIFMALVAVLCYCNYGRLAGMWDEFSHWMDIVKVMSTLDAFGTHPEAESMFQSYPPVMSLFQYFYQKMNSFCSGVIFSEWRAYVAYQIFFVVYLLPFLKEYSYKKIINALLSTIIILLCPLFFFELLYASVYVDPILGILMGSGLAHVFLEKKKDFCYDLTIISTCTMLVLMKDAGLLFAIFLGLFYFLDYCTCNRLKDIAWKDKWKHLLYKCSIFVIIFIIKGLWSFHLNWTKASVQFSTPFNIKTILNVIRGNDTSYRMEVWNNFWYAFAHEKLMLENFNVGISYRSLTLLLALILILLVCLYAKDKQNRIKGILLVTLEGTLLFVYVVGMCITYLTKFSEYEAVRLASFSRYMNIGYLSLGLLILLLITDVIRQYGKVQFILLTVILCGTLAVIPTQKVSSLLKRDAIAKNIANREAYNILADKIATHCDKDDRVYFIAQETAGAEYWIMRYSIRPVKMNSNFTWSIGESFYEGDIYTKELSAEEWQNLLIEKYDYVGIYMLNDYFYETFGSLFEHREDISLNGLYKVNKENGMLEKCE